MLFLDQKCTSSACSSTCQCWQERQSESSHRWPCDKDKARFDVPDDKIPTVAPAFP